MINLKSLITEGKLYPKLSNQINNYKNGNISWEQLLSNLEFLGGQQWADELIKSDRDFIISVIMNKKREKTQNAPAPKKQSVRDPLNLKGNPKHVNLRKFSRHTRDDSPMEMYCPRCFRIKYGGSGRYTYCKACANGFESPPDALYNRAMISTKPTMPIYDSDDDEPYHFSR